MTLSRSIRVTSPGRSSATSLDVAVSRSGLIVWRESDRRVLVVAAALAIVLGVVVSALWIVFGTARVNGMSMKPALLDQDLVLITRGYDEPARGDIVSATVPDEHGRPVGILKRVVGLPGDTVDVHGDSVAVNGVPVPPPTGEARTYGPRFPQVVVPDGHVYLLGDNRFRSYDSRILGPVPQTAVRGRVAAIVLPFSRFSIID